MAIPAINVLGNPNVTEGNFQIAIEDLRKSVIGSGKAYDSANTYSQYDTCVYSGVVYYSKINSNTGNTPAVGTNWGLESDLLAVVTTSGSQTISGLKTFSDGFVSTSATQVIGYATGSGGAVTQLTSKSTAVTLNKPTGRITTSDSTMIGNSTVQFTLNNSLIGINDTILINMEETGAGLNTYSLKAMASIGRAYIHITNTTTTSFSETLDINFTIIKGAIA